VILNLDFFKWIIILNAYIVFYNFWIIHHCTIQIHTKVNYVYLKEQHTKYVYLWIHSRSIARLNIHLYPIFHSLCLHVAFSNLLMTECPVLCNELWCQVNLLYKLLNTLTFVSVFASPPRLSEWFRHGRNQRFLAGRRRHTLTDGPRVTGSCLLIAPQGNVLEPQSSSFLRGLTR